MKLSILPLALGIVLAGAVAANAAAERRVKPIHSHKTIHHRPRAQRHHVALAAPAPGAAAALDAGAPP